ASSRWDGSGGGPGHERNGRDDTSHRPAETPNSRPIAMNMPTRPNSKAKVVRQRRPRRAHVLDRGCLRRLVICGEPEGFTSAHDAEIGWRWRSSTNLPGGAGGRSAEGFASTRARGASGQGGKRPWLYFPPARLKEGIGADREVPTAAPGPKEL